jgi:hypothetical protein
VTGGVSSSTLNDSGKILEVVAINFERLPISTVRPYPQTPSGFAGQVNVSPLQMPSKEGKF